MSNSLRGFLYLFLHFHFLFHPAHTYAAGHPIVHKQITPTPTPSIGSTGSLSPTLTPTETPTPSFTPTPTSTPTPTPTPSASSGPTVTPTVTPTVSPTPTATPSPTETLTPSLTPSPTVTPTPTPDIIGNDISYPQCGLSYPPVQNFGIVGVNGGISTTTNPCLSSELTWASTENSVINQLKIQLYVNTANPGGLNTSSWPKNNTDPSGTTPINPYGTCDGSDSLSCAWQYGWNRGVEDVTTRFVPAAQSAGISTNPSNYPWWLDVETVNTWKSGSSSDLQSNAADLEGMVAYFSSKNIKVGLYSTSLQWGEIVGTVSSGSSLNGLSSWLPGASDLSGAKTFCTKSALTSGGKVVLTQYTSGNFDFDYSCI